MRSRHHGARACLIVAIGLVSLFLSGRLHADMGAIHVSSTDVSVSEPAQKAIVLHNGAEEVLILETDLKASKRTEIVRFIPFPSEPTVTLAPENAIREMGKLVQAKRLQYITYFQTKGGGESIQKQPVAELVSRAKLGAHDVAVVKIHDAEHFKGWVRDFFKAKQQLQKGPELEHVAQVARDYVKDGIPFFVFDCVTIDNSDKSVEPVMFQFKSKKLYYPLRTSNTLGGTGEVQLFFVAIDCVRQPFNNGYHMHLPGSGEASSFLFSNLAEVKPEELTSFYPSAATFFEGKRTFLQSANFSGALHFERDLSTFMLTHYDPSLYDTSGAVQTSAFDPTEVLTGLDPSRLRRPNPVWNAEMLERQRHKIIASLTNVSLYLSAAGKQVQLADGVYKDAALQAETERLAIGDLNGDIFSDAAMITRTITPRGDTCELAVFNGKEVAIHEEPELEPGNSVVLPSCDAADFRIVDKRIKMVGKAGTEVVYGLIGSKLTPVK